MDYDRAWKAQNSLCGHFGKAGIYAATPTLLSHSNGHYALRVYQSENDSDKKPLSETFQIVKDLVEAAVGKIRPEEIIVVTPSKIGGMFRKQNAIE